MNGAMTGAMTGAMRSPAVAALGARLSYAQCWEDEAILRAAAAVGPDDDALSICSGGDNSFALLLAGARSVTALDLSFPQIAVAELKLAATTLPHGDYLTLLGLHPDRHRRRLYADVRPLLSDLARGYWDAHLPLVDEGLLGAGKFERYLAAFRRFVLPLVHHRADVEALCALAAPDEQRRFYAERWDTARWRALFRIFFSRPVMARTGRTRAHFAEVDGPVGAALLARTAHALTALPVRTNPYVQWILRGTFPDLATAPPYLRPEGHARLCERRGDLRFVHGELERFLPAQPRGAYSAFNYSNLFEYVSAAQHEALLRLTLDAARPGARVVYWNLLVPRHRPASLAERLDRREDEAAARHTRDRSFV